MLVDAWTIPSDTVLKTDICIMGAGAAGITLAREFIGQSFRVSVLEGGGLEYDSETQSLYKGENTGIPYFRLDGARLRHLGTAGAGSSISIDWESDHQSVRTHGS
jgi:choline dehydrogenase-like flavoprotein